MKLTREQLLEFRLFKHRRLALDLRQQLVDKEELLWATQVGNELGIDLTQVRIDTDTGQILPAQAELVK